MFWKSPLPPGDVRGYQTLRQLGALPIVMDEGIVSPVEADSFMALGMMDGLTLKVARSAGLWNTQQIVKAAEKYGVFLLGSGLCDPDLSLAASAHAFAGAGISHPCALNGPQYLIETLDTTGFIPASDQIRLPSGAGLGLQLDARAEACLAVVAEAGP